MRRIFLIIALAIVVGAGVVGGNLLTAVRGQTPVIPPAPDVPIVTAATPAPGTVISFTQGRWQILSQLSPDQRQTLVFLLDSVTGTVFLLTPHRTARGGYVWERVERGL